MILAVLGLGALALLPDRDPAERDREPVSVQPKGHEAGAADSGNTAEGADLDAGSRSSPPAPEGTSHGLWPLVPGSEWVYRVSGPTNLTPATSWTLRLIETPAGREPGIVEAGFGDDRKQGQVAIGGDWLFVDALPLTEPIQFNGNRPRRISGTLLPTPEALITHAAWTLVLERQVVHTISDELERPVTRPMRAVQRDRALVEGFEVVAVPAGEFRAARVEWVSQLELFAGKRQVFDALTLEPFRSETMWVAPGIGIVKRQIAWAGSPRSAVTFQLERYGRPGS